MGTRTERGRLRAVTGTVLVAAIAVVGTGCLPQPTEWTDVDGPSVGVVGDSLVRLAHAGGGANHPNPTRLVDDDMAAAGYRSSVSAQIGADTDDLSTISWPEGDGPDILVVGLGTNDMMDASVPVDVAVANLVTFIDRVQPQCTALITIVDEPRVGLDVTAPPYNAALADLADARGDVVLVDWAATADANPSYLSTDGVHHTPEGSVAYREAILDGAQQCTPS